MRKHISNPPQVLPSVPTREGDVCPICNVECEASTEKFISIRRCKEHGVMKTANVFSDAYMAAAYPELVKHEGAWHPKEEIGHTEKQYTPLMLRRALGLVIWLAEHPDVGDSRTSVEREERFQREARAVLRGEGVGWEGRKETVKKGDQ